MLGNDFHANGNPFTEQTKVTAVLVHPQGSPFGNYGEQSDTGAGINQITSILSGKHQTTNAPYSFILTLVIELAK
jgi:hypothetical protein